MTNRTTDATFDLLHRTLAQDLVNRIENGTATAADLNVARAFLKDNGISAVAAPGSPMGTLMQTLPFDQGDEADFH
jgi:hypothetical protein